MRDNRKDAVRHLAGSGIAVIEPTASAAAPVEESGRPFPPGIPRWAEVIMALGGLLLAAPVLLVAIALVALTSSGPVFFLQGRVGRGGRTFFLYKLRTMFDASSGPQVTGRDDARITPVGRVLRRTKLDEVPQFWNVLRGEMSLVGPRPEVPRYVDLEDPLWREVLRVRPGITDPVALRLRNEELLLASVAGDRERYYRSELQPRKLREYLEYLRRRTWRSDLVVLWRTVLAVLLARPLP